MDPRLLDLLVCPLCKGKLRHDRANAELVCRADRLAFPIRDGIPQMLVDNARTLVDAAPEGATVPSEAPASAAPDTSAAPETTTSAAATTNDPDSSQNAGSNGSHTP